jgi:hypothetical protein
MRQRSARQPVVLDEDLPLPVHVVDLPYALTQTLSAFFPKQASSSRCVKP